MRRTLVVWSVRAAAVLLTVLGAVGAARTGVPREVTPSSVVYPTDGIFVAVSEPDVSYDVTYSIAGLDPRGLPERGVVPRASLLVRFWCPRRADRDVTALVVVGRRGAFERPFRSLADVVKDRTAPGSMVTDGLVHEAARFGHYICVPSPGRDSCRGPAPEPRRTGHEVDTFRGRPYLGSQDVLRRKGALWSAGNISIAGRLTAQVASTGTFQSNVSLPPLGAVLSREIKQRVLPMTETGSSRGWYVRQDCDIAVTMHTVVDDARYEVDVVRPETVSTEGEPFGSRFDWRAKGHVAPRYRITDLTAKRDFDEAVESRKSRRDHLRWSLLPTVLGTWGGMELGSHLPDRTARGPGKPRAKKPKPKRSAPRTPRRARRQSRAGG